MLGAVSPQQASAEDLLSWVLLHEMMAGVPSSPERREVSSWALDVLAAELGEDWPKRAVERHVAMHLLSAVGSTIDRARLIEFAIRLRLIRDCPGRRKALQPLLSGDLTSERIRHTDLQLEVATLGAPLGWSAELEKLNIHPSSGIDVRLTRDGEVLDVEVCALLEGDRTKSSFDQNRRIFGMDLGLMATMHRVRVTGHLSDDPTTYDVDNCRAQLMEAIRAVSADGVQRTLSFRGGSVLVSPISDGVDDTFTTPFDAALDPRRFESSLKEKIAQARRERFQMDPRRLHGSLVAAERVVASSDCRQSARHQQEGETSRRSWPHSRRSCRVFGCHHAPRRVPCRVASP